MKAKASREQQIHTLAQQIETQLQSIRQILRRQLEVEFSRGNLTAPQRLVMEVVCKSDGLSLKELSRSVCLAHSTVSGIVDRLEKRGMLTRQISEEDRRMTRILPSDAVREFLQKRAPALTLHPLARALRDATPAQRSAIQEGLNALEQLLMRS